MAFDKQVSFQYSTYMSRKLNLVYVENTLRNKGVKTVTPLQFRRIFDVSPVSAQKFLERYTKKGVFGRVKKGFYIYKSEPPSVYLLANKLYEPSYISFETALSFHKIIPETVYGATSATTQPTREFAWGQTTLSYHKIKKEAFTGYGLISIGEEAVLMAEKEKAVVDFLYFVSLGERRANDRMKTEGLDLEKLKGFAALYQRDSLEELINALSS